MTMCFVLFESSACVLNNLNTCLNCLSGFYAVCKIANDLKTEKKIENSGHDFEVKGWKGCTKSWAFASVFFCMC